MCYQIGSVAEVAAAAAVCLLGNSQDRRHFAGVVVHWSYLSIQMHRLQKCLLVVVVVAAVVASVQRDFQEAGFVVEAGRTNCLQEAFDFVVEVDQIRYQEEESDFVVDFAVAVDRINYQEEESGFAAAVADRINCR